MQGQTGRGLLALTALLAAATLAPMAQAKTKSGTDWPTRLERLVPKTWRRESGLYGKDAWWEFSLGGRSLRLQKLGGPGSRHKDFNDYLQSPEGLNGDGSPARAVERGWPMCDGESGDLIPAVPDIPLYRRFFQRAAGEGPPEPVVEEFTKLHAPGPSFYVLNFYRSGPPAPEPEKDEADLLWDRVRENFLGGGRCRQGKPQRRAPPPPRKQN